MSWKKWLLPEEEPSGLRLADENLGEGGGLADVGECFIPFFLAALWEK